MEGVVLCKKIILFEKLVKLYFNVALLALIITYNKNKITKKRLWNIHSRVGWFLNKYLK